jgi:hypothetical protein
MRFMARTNTTASSQRTPAGFNNNYDLWLAPTQQQAHKELLQDLQQIRLLARTNTTASSQRTPAGF